MITVPIHPHDKKKKSKNVVISRGNCVEKSGLTPFFTSAFMHVSLYHLGGNMLFLWALGGVLETRVGSLRYLKVYFLCILTSKIFSIILLILQALLTGSPLELENYHSLGASGAIAGIMGMFVVRCYFARIKLTIPFLFFPIFSVPLKVQGTLLTGLFFALDLVGSVNQFKMDSNINYWAHVGGYVGGFIIGYLMKLHKEAPREALEMKAERLSQKTLRRKDATSLYEEILWNEPENETALTYFFKLHRYNQKKREFYFGRLIQVLMKKDFSKARDFLDENFPNFLRSIPSAILVRFGLFYLRSGDLAKTCPCLELAAEKEGPWQPKAMFSLGLTYREIGRVQLARKTLEDVAGRFPATAFHHAALTALMALK
ncbi:rhomboid family intramembrane serine protease [bacterium]|nr:rhomboid family intramembrane serine protease [bacterium]